MQQDALSLSSWMSVDKSSIKDEISWRKSLRPCHNKIISDCPAGYENEPIRSMCKSYQSIVATYGKHAFKTLTHLT